jgi:hypothetical protein
MNHHQHCVGAAPLPEIHHNETKPNFFKDNNPKKNSRSARHRCNRRKNRQLAKMALSPMRRLTGPPSLASMRQMSVEPHVPLSRTPPPLPFGLDPFSFLPGPAHAPSSLSQARLPLPHDNPYSAPLARSHSPLTIDGR